MALSEHLPSAETIYYNRNGVRDAEGDDGSREDSIERGGGAQEDAAEHHVEDDGQYKCIER